MGTIGPPPNHDVRDQSHQIHRTEARRGFAVMRAAKIAIRCPPSDGFGQVQGGCQTRCGDFRSGKTNSMSGPCGAFWLGVRHKASLASRRSLR
jgi:hypothetical protein